jgi:DNA mismatch repair protein MutS2
MLECRAGALRMKVRADGVRLIEADERAASEPKKAPAAGGGRMLRAAAPRELDIRGMESLEAESVVENYIDAAVLARLETVTIIHGKGTGALRKAVHALLKRNKSVKSFRLGAFGEGEAGVTVVELR